MKYMFLLYGVEQALPEPGTPEHREMFTAYRDATQAMAAAGVLIDCAPLEPSGAATTVRVRGDEVLLTDGPAAEIKEHLGGYTLVECADLDEALKWAATIPAARGGSVEVRPVVAVQAPPVEAPPVEAPTVEASAVQAPAESVASAVGAPAERVASAHGPGQPVGSVQAAGSGLPSASA